MSEVIDPPEFYFTGINFNPAFYAQDAGSGISEAEANALYLRKTVADTATAVETFNAGIVTPSVTSTGALNIVVPAVLSTDVLNVGVVTRGIAGQVHHYSDGDNCVAGAAVHINNGISNGSNTNVMNGTNTTGTLNLMTGGNATGTVNIMTAASSGNVNIKTGNNSTGTTTIGQRNTTSQTTTTVKGNVNIASDAIGGGTNPTINIGNYTSVGLLTTTNIQGDVNIGTVGGDTVIRDLTADYLTTDVIYGTAANAYMEIGKDITTGPVGNLAISLGNELTTGKVEIGKNQTSGTITLGSSTSVISVPGKLQTQFIRAPTTTGITYINDDATGSGCTILGSAGTRTKIAGTLETSAIRTAATNGALTIGTDQTSGGTITIGSSATTTTMNGTVQAYTIQGGIAVGDVLTIASNITSGSINIGTSISSGDHITIGSTTAGSRVVVNSALANNKIEGTAIGSAMTIGNNITSGSITIGSALESGNKLTFGSSACATTVNGTLKTNTIESTGVSTALAVGGNITDAGISIGAAQTSGQINIGLLATRTGDINIGNNIEGGIVKIANNMSATSTASVQAGTTNRGTHYYRGANINICDDGGNVNIGVASSGTITLNRPITTGYSPSAITASQIGFSYKYSFASSVVVAGGNLTVASFTNTPIGIYLFTCGPSTIFTVTTATRADFQFTTTTNITALTAFTNMEMGGNLIGKMPLTVTFPISITNATNQLTCVISNQAGSDFNVNVGASSLVKIA
jgi:hypothetical protein